MKKLLLIISSVLLLIFAMFFLLNFSKIQINTKSYLWVCFDIFSNNKYSQTIKWEVWLDNSKFIFSIQEVAWENTTEDWTVLLYEDKNDDMLFDLELCKKKLLGWSILCEEKIYKLERKQWCIEVVLEWKEEDDLELNNCEKYKINDSINSIYFSFSQ